MIIYSTTAYSYFAHLISQQMNIPYGNIYSDWFPDGEMYHQISTSPRGEDVILVGGTNSEINTLELYDIACGLIANGARSLKIIIPYYGYSTMERSTKKGEIVKAKTRAMLLSAIPSAGTNNEIIMLDLHSEGIPHYFSSDVNTVHLYAKSIIIDAANSLGGTNFILASTDAGRAKWVESLANDMGVDSAFVYKKRISGDKTQITGINANVKDRIVIIYDDMIRTGGSLTNAAKAYLEAGANRVYAITTHLVTTDEIRDKIHAQNYITKIIGTNSHSMSIDLANNFLMVRDVSTVFSDYLCQKLNW